MSSSSQFGPSAPPPKSSGGRSVLIIILIVMGVLLLSCAGICGGVVFLTRSAAEAGMAYVELLPTMDRGNRAPLMNDQQVIDKLGEPVELSTIPARTGKGELKPGERGFRVLAQGLENDRPTSRPRRPRTSAPGRSLPSRYRRPTAATFNVPPPAASGPDVQFDMPDVPVETK